MSRKGKIGVGIIGAGWIAKKGHIAGFKSHEEAEIVAICGRTREKVEKVAQEYGILRVFTDYRELLELKEIDVVTIATPDYLHYPMTMDAIAAGKHIICEKPLAMNYAQAREMYEKAEARGLFHMTGFTWRFTPMAIKIRELVEAGFLGRVFHVTASTLLGFGGYRKEPRTVSHPISGFLAGAGSHLIDLTMSFAGGIQTVCGDAAQHIKEPPLWIESGGEVRKSESDDSTTFLARFESSAQGMFHTSRVATGEPAAGFMRIAICGDRGGLVHELKVGPGCTSQVLASTLGEGSFKPVPPSEPYWRNWDSTSYDANIPYCWEKLTGEMLRAIKTGAKPQGTFYEGMKSQEIIDAVLLSSQEQRWVPLPLTG